MKKIKILILVVAVLITSLVVSRNLIKQRELQAEKEKFERMIFEIGELIQNEIPLIIKQEEFVEDATCSYTSGVAYDKSRGYYNWAELYSAKIYVKDEFDSWPEAKQYSYIDEIGDYTSELFSNNVRANFEDYGMYRNYDGILSEVYGGFVFSDVKEAVTLKTSKNTYVYSANIDNYFQKNGKDVFVRDEYGNWDGGFSGGYVQSDNGRCALGHCDHTAKEGSPYCHTHGCCIDGCRKRKDPLAHCCDYHNCKHSGCGAHRYTYIGSDYCQMHYDEH